MAKYSLIGVDGNAFAVMGYVVQAMKEQSCSIQERSDYQKEAMSSDYNHLLVVSMEQVEKLNQKDLVKKYEDTLQKVKLLHNPEDHPCNEILREQCKGYISFAEKELEEVKNGRTW